MNQRLGELDPLRAPRGEEGGEPDTPFLRHGDDEREDGDAGGDGRCPSSASGDTAALMAP